MTECRHEALSVEVISSNALRLEKVLGKLETSSLKLALHYLKGLVAAVALELVEGLRSKTHI